MQSRFFSPHLRAARCVVPAKSYFEWKSLPDKKKEKYRIYSGDGKLMYMAGFIRQDKAFAILTRDASDNISFIHNRMPLILPEHMISTWLGDAFKEDIVHMKSIPVNFALSV